MGGISYGQTWQKVALKDLTSDDAFVIVDVVNGFAISNAKTTENPKAVQVSLNGDELTGDVDGNLMWKVTSVGGDYTFTSKASPDNILYWVGGKKTGLRVGTPSSTSNGKFNESTSDIYTGLKTKSANRYICYSSDYKDWRCYASANNTKLAYFKLVVDTRTPTNVTFGAEVDGKYFPVTEGKESTFLGKTATEKDGVAGTITYSSNNTDVVSVNESTGAVTFGKFGIATITALFTPTDDVTYKESSASYTIN